MIRNSNVDSMVVDDRAVEEKPIDREKTCPLLLRVFCSNSRHNPMGEYVRGSVPSNELQIYTWKDCTLRELTSLIKEVNPDARRKGTYFEFAIVHPEPTRQNHRLREIGVTCAGQRGMDDNKTLQSCNFEIGDYIDVAVTVPGSRPMNRRPGPGRPY